MNKVDYYSHIYLMQDCSFRIIINIFVSAEFTIEWRLKRSTKN